jgi:tetraacyldisaccharide 4'-kinase
LIDVSSYHDIISGKKRGLAAMLTRCMLRLIETPYAMAMKHRNRLYDRKQSDILYAAVPVVSVGNMTLGGTGKTPMVEWIARWFRSHETRVSIISRGYKSEEGGRNDEAQELEQRLDDVPHIQNADRVAAAKIAVEELETQVIILDDGFQHRRLARDLDIVLLDALEPFGLDHVFPRGTLREPLAGLRRADAVILSRADLIEPEQREAIRRRVEKYAPKTVWAEVRHAPHVFFNSSNGQIALESLKDQPVAAFCGLGNPTGFRRTVESLGCRLVDFYEYPDHYAYSRDDIAQLTAWAEQQKVSALLCTHKDLVKIGLDQLGEVPLWAVRVEIDFLSGQEAFETKLDAILAQIEREATQ